jgi:hypothetical protein
MENKPVPHASAKQKKKKNEAKKSSKLTLRTLEVRHQLLANARTAVDLSHSRAPSVRSLLRLDAPATTNSQ